MSKYKLIYPSHSLIKIINLAKLSSINHIRHYKIKSSIETVQTSGFLLVLLPLHAPFSTFNYIDGRI